MNLHRSSKKPDWDLVKPSSRNSLQVIAAATSGVVTLPNIISLLGLILVVFGVASLFTGQYWLALGLLVTGRLLDLADGIIADKTGTKSPLGELVDATADKIATFLTIAAFLFAGIADWWLIILLLLPQVIIAFTILYKKRGGIRVQPTRPGKLSMALIWASLAGLLIVKAVGLSWLHPLSLVVEGIILSSAILGFYALWQYATGRD